VIRRKAIYEDGTVVLLLEGGQLAFRLKKASSFVTPKIPVDRDELYKFEFDHRMRFGPNGTNPRIVGGTIEIVSYEPGKVRVYLKGSCSARGLSTHCS